MKISEGAMKGDLKRLVVPELIIDRFKSKMGEDDDIVVLAYMTINKEPAVDLVNFFETGYSFILDADVSTGEVMPDRYLVFVELSRRTKSIEQIIKITEEMLNLTDQTLDEWKFSYGPVEDERKVEKYPLTVEELERHLPTSPKEYRDRIEAKQKPKQDDDEIAALKTSAGLPVNQTAPNDEFIESLKTLSGQI